MIPRWLEYDPDPTVAPCTRRCRQVPPAQLSVPALEVLRRVCWGGRVVLVTAWFEGGQLPLATRRGAWFDLPDLVEAKRKLPQTPFEPHSDRVCTLELTAPAAAALAPLLLEALYPHEVPTNATN